MFRCLILTLFWSINEVSHCFLDSIRATGRCYIHREGTYCDETRVIVSPTCSCFMFESLKFNMLVCPSRFPQGFL